MPLLLLMNIFPLHPPNLTHVGKSVFLYAMRNPIIGTAVKMQQSQDMFLFLIYFLDIRGVPENGYLA